MINIFQPVAGRFAAAVAIVAFAGFTPVWNADIGVQPVRAAEAGIHLAPGLVLPPMDPVRGKALFASTGCVVCHAINGVGGTDAPSISADTMAAEMNPFDLVAKMWNHSQGMIAMQMNELGHQIMFEDGQEIADIVAFLHDAEVQKTFSEADIPDDIKEQMDEDMDGEGMDDKSMGSMMEGSSPMRHGSMMNGN